SLAGLRIGLLTDVHRSRWVSHEDVAGAVAALMADRPDLIVLGGDYVTWGDRQYVAPSAEALQPLEAPHGVFGILGNHDDDHDMPAALGRRGVQVLRDARTRLIINNETVDLIGIRFWTKRGADLAALTKGAAPTTFLLAHDPRRLAEASALGVPLVLSGHTHGGQVVLPQPDQVMKNRRRPVGRIGKAEVVPVDVPEPGDEIGAAERRGLFVGGGIPRIRCGAPRRLVGGLDEIRNHQRAARRRTVGHGFV